MLAAFLDGPKMRHLQVTRPCSGLGEAEIGAVTMHGHMAAKSTADPEGARARPRGLGFGGTSGGCMYADVIWVMLLCGHELVFTTYHTALARRRHSVQRMQAQKQRSFLCHNQRCDV